LRFKIDGPTISLGGVHPSDFHSNTPCDTIFQES
jgi:hypothetical protein